MGRILLVTDILASIDPGEWAGYALWSGFRLIGCGRMQEGKYWKDSKCVCEMPRIYPIGKSQSRPNDIIKLAVTAGRLSAPWPDPTWLAPHEWKGQVPDDILERRILGKLLTEELHLFTQLDLPKSRKHNVTDAIGIGLYFLKRMGTGGS
jgi:hypothetical protein